MRMSEGVEWGLHCCVALGWIGQDEVVSTARLAAKFNLPAAYLNKSLQALARAGILASSAGPKGGFRLARPPAKITLLEVVDAIEGAEAAFRCTEIRQNGEGAAPPAECRRPCAIASAMRSADVYCAPNLGGESFGIVLVEAMAAGTPVVASELDAFSRVLDGGQAGRLVPVGDADALADALIEVLADDALREKYIDAATQRVARYDWSVVAGQIMRVYETVASTGVKVQVSD